MVLAACMLFNNARSTGSFLLREYRQTGAFYFTAIALFLTVETIGPAFGVWYLIPVVRRKETFAAQLPKILRNAVLWSVIPVTSLAVLLEILSGMWIQIRRFN